MPAAPLPAQHAGIEALNKRTDTNYIREEFQRRRDLIYDGINAIDGLACRPVPATFYAFVDIGRTELRAEDFVYRLLDCRRVAVVHGSAYGGSRYDRYIRIAFTLEEEKLKEALRRIRMFMASL